MFELRRSAMLMALLTLLAGCASEIRVEPEPENVALHRFAAKVLGDVQPRSIRENVEYCGAIGYNEVGELVATQPVAGGPDWCEFMFPGSFDVVASYHTHAAYNPKAWSELPSDDDVLDDARNGVDGYVSTPGGRLWFVNGRERSIRQVCGLKCLPSDPRWKPETDTDIRGSYTLRELQGVLNG